MDILKAISADAWHSLHASFDLLWSKLSSIVPSILLVLLVLAIGLKVADLLTRYIDKIVKKSKIDILLDNIISPVTKLTETKIHTSTIIEVTVKWFLIALVLIAGFNLADLNEVVDFFNQALGYLPNLFIATLIILVGTLLAKLASAIIGLVSKSTGLASTAKAAVNTLAFIAALGQIATPLMASLNRFVAHLSLSHLQADVLFIGLLVLILYASKNVVIKAVENLYKS